MYVFKPFVKNQNVPAIDPVPTWSAQPIPQTGSVQEDEVRGITCKQLFTFHTTKVQKTSRGHPRSDAVMYSTWS